MFFVEATSSSANNVTLVLENVPDAFSHYTDYASPDWDGDGALPISQEAIAAARRFLADLPRRIPSPDINPGSDGSIGISWVEPTSDLQKVFIYIFGDGAGPQLAAYARWRDGRVKSWQRAAAGVQAYNVRSELFPPRPSEE